MANIFYFKDYFVADNELKHKQRKKIKMADNNNVMMFIRELREDDTLKDDIPKCANKILERFKIDTYKKRVPIVKILHDFGINTYVQELFPDELSAYIAVNPKFYSTYGTTKIACVNSNGESGHMRFALAHELGHYIFDFDETENPTYYNTYIKDSGDDDESENMANEFAANLLMPKETFIKKRDELLKKNNKDMSLVVVGLAKHFGVLTDSVMKRIEEVRNTV